jgi:hypothetical protein
MDWTLHARWVLASREQAGRTAGLTRWNDWDLALYEANVQYLATGLRHRVYQAVNRQWMVRRID